MSENLVVAFHQPDISSLPPITGTLITFENTKVFLETLKVTNLRFKNATHLISNLKFKIILNFLNIQILYLMVHNSFL